MRGRFQGMYWRQTLVTAGLVFLTLLLTGGGFFAVSRRYARTDGALAELAGKLAEVAVEYLEGGKDLPDAALQETACYQRMRGFDAALLGKVRFLICDAEGRILLCNDESLQGRVLRMPEGWTGKILEGQTVRDRAEKLFGKDYFVSGCITGVPARGRCRRWLILPR